MKKILVIDYDQNSLASLQGILSREGYQVVTAPDGQAGWDKYNKESPDLVLMEAMLPKVHGFELCQRITSERNSQATVFIMTGVYKDRVYRTEALRTYGASEYFEKPLKMAELLASIEAVLGKPESKTEFISVETSPPAPEPVSAKPVRETPSDSMPAEPRRREKPKSDDDEFSLPPDLDRLSREIPKIRKSVPARHETPLEPRLEALADELLKSVVGESAPRKTTVEARPTGGNGNERESAEIEQFLKSALADLDLKKEKVKAPKTAPLAPPPAEEEEKPRPTLPPPFVFKPKSAPPAPPVAAKPEAEKPKPSPAAIPDAPFFAPVEPAPKSTLIPGDPGSDISPFVTLEKPKPEVPAEKPIVRAEPSPAAISIPSPRPFKPAEPEERKPAPAAAPHPQFRPIKQEAREREAEAIASADMFQSVGQKKVRKSVPPLVAVGVGVVVIAAVGFLTLRPKHTAPADENLRASQALNKADVPVQPVVEEAPPPEISPAPVKPKAKPQRKTEDSGLAGLEAIIPSAGPPAAPSLIETRADAGNRDSQVTAGSTPAQAEPPPAKTEETPPQKTEGNPPQGATADVGSTTNQGESVAAPATTPAAVPANEGDLVDLNSVTEPPKLLKSVNPVYPQAALQLGIEGSITIKALIDEKGNVIDTGILKGIQDDKGLGRAAENALKKWRFQPARKDGVAVKVWKTFVIAFQAGKSQGI